MSKSELLTKLLEDQESSDRRYDIIVPWKGNTITLEVYINE
jgi:hypothetical protein